MSVQLSLALEGLDLAAVDFRERSAQVRNAIRTFNRFALEENGAQFVATLETIAS
jgi:hypothetical protein